MDSLFGREHHLGCWVLIILSCCLRWLLWPSGDALLKTQSLKYYSLLDFANIPLSVINGFVSCVDDTLNVPHCLYLKHVFYQSLSCYVITARWCSDYP